MDQEMIHQWQTQVAQNDIVYMLGDVFWCNAEKAAQILRRLPGQKHLIYGNHDDMIRGNATVRGMFASVADYKEIRINGEKLILFHYPIWEWHHIHRGSIHLHGHIHSPASGVPGRIVNVCVDSEEMSNPLVPYALYSAESVIRYALTKPERTHHGKLDL
jgi:calcineurin-like phosphoesterase family protein